MFCEDKGPKRLGLVVWTVNIIMNVVGWLVDGGVGEGGSSLLSWSLEAWTMRAGVTLTRGLEAPKEGSESGW